MPTVIRPYQVLTAGVIGIGVANTPKFLSVVNGVTGLLAALGPFEWEIPHDGLLWQLRHKSTLGPVTGADSFYCWVENADAGLSLTTSGAGAQDLTNSAAIAVTAGQKFIFKWSPAVASASTDVNLSVRYLPGGR